MHSCLLCFVFPSLSRCYFSEINRDRKNGISPSKTNAIPPGQDFDYVNELFDRIAAYIPFTDTHNVCEMLCSLLIFNSLIAGSFLIGIQYPHLHV